MLKSKTYPFQNIEDYRELLSISNELKSYMRESYEQSGLNSDYPLNCLDELRHGITDDYLKNNISYNLCKEELKSYLGMHYSTFYQKIFPLDTDY